MVGSIKREYHNEIMSKYRVIYADGSEDYISVEDIDGVEIMLLTNDVTYSIFVKFLG